MRKSRTTLKLGVSSVALLMMTVLIVVVFGQLRFDRTSGYSAIFSSASGLRAGQFVRASGVEVGKVVKVAPTDGGTRARVDFNVDRSLPLYEGTTASIRYLNLVGDRYLELKRGERRQRMPASGTIPIDRTEPALDLDALIGGFRPLFRALDPGKVNTISASIVTVLQGQGGTINDLLDQTASLTSAIADRDKTIGEVIVNLNSILATTVKHQQQFDSTIDDFEKLISGLNTRSGPLAGAIADLSNAADSLGGLLADDRPALKTTVAHLENIQQPLVQGDSDVDDLLTKLPSALRLIGRAGGIYGDFFNFYLCDISVKLNGLQPGGPVRTVHLFGQPTGRCMPQ